MGETCRHLWQPYADGVRIWQRCAKCGVAEHVTTYKDALMDSLAYILREDRDAIDRLGNS